MSDAGNSSLARIGVSDRSGLVNQVDQLSLDYANDRAAEMIGKKWVNGVLVDNPDADWVISDTTRDEIQTIIADALQGKIELKDLSDNIANAGAFSEDRAAMIARTEIARANGQGSLMGYKIARNGGVKLKKEWLPDAEACPICEENGDDGAIDLDDDFSSGDDAPPAHPNCECSLSPVVEEEDDNEVGIEDDE